MSKLYNKHFKIGVGFSLTSFVILNVISFVRASRDYEARNWSFPRGVLVWGFPYTWAWDASQVQLIPNPVFNVGIIVLSSFAAGFLFRYFGGKAQSVHH